MDSGNINENKLLSFGLIHHGLDIQLPNTIKSRYILKHITKTKNIFQYQFRKSRVTVNKEQLLSKVWSLVIIYWKY